MPISLDAGLVINENNLGSALEKYCELINGIHVCSPYHIIKK
jgi:hypothetical protein